MMKSESIGNLAKALSQVQAVLRGAIKDSNNPFFKSSYADLSSVWDACREPLAKHGLSIIQTTDVADNGVIVETTLAHESGEWISGRLLLNPTKHDPQGIGSALTYGRRYSLAAIVGVCPEDDDGEGAMGREHKKAGSGSQKQGGAASSPPPPAPPDKDFAYLQAMGKEKARVGEEQYRNMLGIHGYEKSTEVPVEKRKEIYNAMKTIKDKEKQNG